MFQLTMEEYQVLRSQFATLKQGAHSKYLPYAFTEYGILMLSSVLRSKRAEKVNILIIETFVRLNKMLSANKKVLLKLVEMEKRISGQDVKMLELFEYLKQFVRQDSSRKKIGFKSDLIEINISNFCFLHINTKKVVVIILNLYVYPNHN